MSTGNKILKETINQFETMNAQHVVYLKIVNSRLSEVEEELKMTQEAFKRNLEMILGHSSEEMFTM